MMILDDHWTWDFWTVKEGDTYHLFFLKAPKSLGDPDLRHHNARVGHAISADLRNWFQLEDALAPGASGQWDDLATWTGSVIRAEGRWHMFYTGVNRAEDGLIQRIGRATSEDLLTWVKDDGFLVQADPRWYEQLDPAVWFDLTWRDPWVYFDEELAEYRMLVTARSLHGRADARGVIGLARSDNLTDWEVLPPLASPGEFGHMEVPQLQCIHGRWYLFFSVYEWAHGEARTSAGLAHCGTHYLVGASPRGPFTLTTPHFFSGDPKGELYAGRVVEAPDGDFVFLGFLQFVEGGAFVGGLSDPLPIAISPDGELSIERGEQWSSRTAQLVAGRTRGDREQSAP